MRAIGVRARQGLAVKPTLTAIFILMSAGCAPVPPAETSPVEAGSSRPIDLASCTRAGGTMKPVGRMQTLQCVISYADGGKSCRSGADCAGDCRAQPGLDVRPGQQVAGFCQATSDRFGCSTAVENGRALPTICID